MADQITSSRDVILRTNRWQEAVQFYEKTVGFTVVHRDAALVGFNTGAFILYVEQGDAHGAVFDFLTPNVNAAKKSLVAAGCTVVEEDFKVPRCYLKDPFGLVFNLGIRGSGIS